MSHIRIGIVGGGPTSLYLLKGLLDKMQNVSITLFEAGPVFGPGMPYSEGFNADYMLCNAFSREIPIVTQSLVEWLLTLPARELSEWELSYNDVHVRAFYPRVLIGEFLKSEFDTLVSLAPKLGSMIKAECNSRVVDIGDAENGQVFVKTMEKIELFDHAIVATGHVWSPRPKINDVPLLSPWPYKHVTNLREQNVGILGSSLSAIDIVVALGFSRGEFAEESGVVSWVPAPDQRNFKITMISKMGIMPEGDFYYPYPYEPLKIITSEAVKIEVDRGSDGLLNRVFNLLLLELDISDPNYLRNFGGKARTIEGFAEGYFQRRKELGGLLAVKKDFATVRKSMRDRQTIPHRYVLMRAHEEFDLALRSLDAEDWEIFREKLLPVFADCYAAVPHLSVARIIAMYDAGVLSLVDTGENARFRRLPSNGIQVELDTERFEFDVLIDARGQSPSQLGDLPFPSLVEILKATEIPVEAPFKLHLNSNANLSIYCVAMPQLLERHPFSQGLQNCAEIAEFVVNDIAMTVPTGNLKQSSPGVDL